MRLRISVGAIVADPFIGPNRNGVAHKQPILEAENYATILQELGHNVKYAAEVGQGAAVMIKPALKRGRKVILARTIYFLGPNDKGLLREISGLLKSDDDWEVWENIG